MTLCFLMRDKKEVDLEGDRGGRAERIRGRGRSNQNVLCENKSIFSKSKKKIKNFLKEEKKNPTDLPCFLSL